MKKISVLRAMGVAAITMVAAVAQAAALMPNFADVPTGWATDRYAPASFSNVGTYQGRDNVLGIGITSAGDSANRGGLSASFYNTQGKQHAVSGGVGSSIAAALYINGSWSSNTKGYVRSDMWGVVSNNVEGILGWPILGFTNQGGTGLLRLWTNSGWTNLITPVAYDAWTSFQIDLTSTAIDYYVNGIEVYSDASIYSGTTPGAITQFSSVIMQAYNFADPALFPRVQTVDYVAHWSNVPEPASLALAGIALVGLFASRRRKSA